jgi:hypothetical protein
LSAQPHIARICAKLGGNAEQILAAIARYCAEVEGPRDPKRPEIAVLLAYDFDNRINNGGLLEYFSKGMGGRDTVAALAAIGAAKPAALLKKAYERTPDAFLASLALADSDDDEADLDIDEDELFSWEESLDELDDAYYDLPRAMPRTGPVDGMPVSGPPLSAVQAALFAFITARQDELDEAIEPVWQRLKAAGKIG